MFRSVLDRATQLEIQFGTAVFASKEIKIVAPLITKRENQNGDVRGMNGISVVDPGSCHGW